MKMEYQKITNLLGNITDKDLDLLLKNGQKEKLLLVLHMEPIILEIKKTPGL